MAAPVAAPEFVDDDQARWTCQRFEDARTDIGFFLVHESRICKYASILLPRIYGAIGDKDSVVSN
jgi:hypothetical protein